MESITKKCLKCMKEKDISNFYYKKSTCKECVKNRVKKWCNENKERRKEIANKYARNNKKKIDEWRARNKDKVNKSKRDYYERNKTFVRNSINEWHKKNPDKTQEYKRNRRARVDGNGGKISAKEWLSLCEKYENKCVCCGSKDKLTLDHIVPISLGGKHNIDNAQPLCLTCNLKKSTKIIDYRNKKEGKLLG